MSFDATLAAHDTAALTALASAGLLRRATRELEAGKGQITARSADQATVETEGHTVRIDAGGAKAATCTCPASGVCRHILLAVLLLQSDAPPADSTPQTYAADDLNGLEEAAIQKFAGADWAAALKIATQGARIEDSGTSCSIHFEQGDIRVTFVAGQGLSGAAYKGPHTRQRAYVTAAALAVRGRAGLAVSEAALPEDDMIFRPGFCQDVARVIENAVAGTINGSAVIAADRLFDLAISARASAAPRLAAQLRGLSSLAALAAKRDIGFDPGAFVEAAARCYGLAQALAHHPDDPDLSGTIARSYQTVPPLDLWVMGSASWRTTNGARGMTVHLYDPHAKRWYGQVTARGAGKDLGFSASDAYFGALWGGGSPETLKGMLLRLPEPRVSGDGQISSTLSQAAAKLGGPLQQDILERLAFDDWEATLADLATRTKAGLRRSAKPQPALLRPAGFGEMTFDDFAQVYRLPVIDQYGAEIELTIDAKDESQAPALYAARSSIRAILVEAAASEEGWSIRPVTAMLAEQGGLYLVDLSFEHIRRQRTLAAQLTKLQDKWRKYTPRHPSAGDPLIHLCDQTVANLVDALGVPVEGAPLIARLQAAGFSSLATAAGRAFGARDPRSILAAAYIAAELRSDLAAGSL
ncbi:SWIM zinc finger family protein [Actibacterium sp. 188UL27-1]|uniref:SWIM zinc finger family protein n=1 Tax=Actibacterium sp. 188UL27-1 TaxID=2786961 RepID=UPI00195D4C61|nr:SWIM zinc finger family protein [Actibacterium sp. 188UL27-1]MBM7070297.1 SWIM zinc finger family protein [Actibacterium sp. 188UL27-1]